MVGLLNIFRLLAKDKDFRHLTIFVIFIIVIGTVFYHEVEDWRWLDSVYFCIMTLTTVGYGDLYPLTDGGKIFTILYIIIGLGVLLGYIKVVADIALKNKFGLINLITEKTRNFGKKSLEKVSKPSEKLKKAPHRPK
ncbi:MAG: two pore domain potassium channel family protein [Thermoplasmata archaeon]|nr:two pore domain potassium channel family protein [Thermoplasmata archaeon]